MGKYLSEKEKECLRQVIMVWDSKGGPDVAPPPSFTEFDRDQRTPKANSLAYYFGSYSEAIRKAQYYARHRELLEPAPPKPANTGASSIAARCAKVKQERAAAAKLAAAPVTEVAQPPAQASAPAPTAPTQPEPAESAKAAEPAIDASTPPKPAPEPAESAKKANAFRNFKFGSNDSKKAQDAFKSPPLRQSIGDLIPAEFLEATPDEPENTTPEPTPLRKDDFTNYLPDKIVFISTELYEAFIHNEIKIDETAYAQPSYDHIIPPSDCYATVATTVVNAGRYEITTNNDTIYVPISKTNLTPQLIKNELVYRFPEPKAGVRLLVTHNVATAAADDGRDTDDLF